MEFVDGRASIRSAPGSPHNGRDGVSGIVTRRPLAYAHAQGVVHRDVKPANIIDGPTDWLDSRLRHRSLVDTSTLTLPDMLGTATYIGSRTIGESRRGPSADVWSLGIVLSECLTGERVYAGTPSEVLARRLGWTGGVARRTAVSWRLLLTGISRPSPRIDCGALDVSAMLAPQPSGRPGFAAVPASDVTNHRR